MVFDVSGKVALVTGGASGIGLQYAKALLRNGAKGVTVADVNSSAGRDVIEDIEKEFGKNKAIFVETDVSDRDQFENAFKRTIEEFKYIDILFNNAGVFNDFQWEREIDINLKGIVHGILLGLENYLQKYRQSEESIIVNTASVTALWPFEGAPIYSAIKAGIVSLTKTWGSSYHYEWSKVKCIAICPGATNTPLASQLNKTTLGEQYEKFVQESTYVAQPPEYVGEETVRIIPAAQNGTVWVIEDQEPAYEYVFLDREAMKKYTTS